MKTAGPITCDHHGSLVPAAFKAPCERAAESRNYSRRSPSQPSAVAGFAFHTQAACASGWEGRGCHHSEATAVPARGASVTCVDVACSTPKPLMRQCEARRGSRCTALQNPSRVPPDAWAGSREQSHSSSQVSDCVGLFSKEPGFCWNSNLLSLEAICLEKIIFF